MKTRSAIFALLTVLGIANTAQAKDCWATADLVVQRAGGAIEHPMGVQSGVASVVQLFPGDEAFINFESLVEWSCPNAFITLTLNGTLVVNEPAGGSYSMQLTEAGYYKPDVSGGGIGGIYLEVGTPFFLTFTTPTPVLVSAKAWLDGAFDQAAGLMTDDLRAAGVVPLTNGTSSTSAAVLAVTGPNAVVDWVSVALRVTPDAGQMVATQWALIQRDGDMVAMDGSSPLTFNVPAGNYYVVLRHRNHLGVMTASPVALTATAATIDFRSASLSTYGTNARRTIGADQLLWAGMTSPLMSLPRRVSYTGSYNDRDQILTRIGGTLPTATTTGYFKEDVNMDGVVKYVGANNDRDLVLIAIGGTTPNAVRTEQVP